MISLQEKEEAYYTFDMPVQAIWETSLEVQNIADEILKDRLEQRKGHNAILAAIPLDQRSNQNDDFTFGEKTARGGGGGRSIVGLKPLKTNF